MPMNKSMLITRPDHDPITKYFCAWSESVVNFAKEKSLNVYDLKGKKSNRREFISYVKNHAPSVIFLNGHGNADIVSGYDNEPLIGVDNCAFLNNSIIYTRSCEVGQSLGPQIVKNGAKAFIGYRRKFFCGYSPDKITRPLDDSMARLFLEPSYLVVSTLIKNNSVEDAHARSKKAMYKNFRRMVSSSWVYAGYRIFAYGKK